MSFVIRLFIWVFGTALILLSAVMALNYFNSGIAEERHGIGEKPSAGSTISVLNWNIGYAGLGKDSDFVMDGGQMLLPPSREYVQTNVAGIQRVLEQNTADIHLFQEISEPDMLTWGIDVLGNISESMPTYAYHYSSDFRTRFIPTRWALRHGMATFSRIQTAPTALMRLVNEPTRLGSVVQRQYHIQKTAFSTADGNDWVILNIHLSAFDEGGNVRLQQLDELIGIADGFYRDGKHVIVGGDWNIQLSEAEFPHTTAEEFLFWRTKLPREKLKPGWEIIVDETVPTMRSNERTYNKGENFTSIIDGYMVSPNVVAISVKTIDTNFEFTDHQPILAEFKAKE